MNPKDKISLADLRELGFQIATEDDPYISISMTYDFDGALCVFSVDALENEFDNEKFFDDVTRFEGITLFQVSVRAETEERAKAVMKTRLETIIAAVENTTSSNDLYRMTYGAPRI